MNKEYVRYADLDPDGFPIEVVEVCVHDDHIDYSEDRSLLRGDPLDVARWLLCSEGWLHDAAMLDEYVAEAKRRGAPQTYADAVRALHPTYYSTDDPTWPAPPPPSAPSPRGSGR